MTPLYLASLPAGNVCLLEQQADAGDPVLVQAQVEGIPFTTFSSAFTYIFV